MKKNSSANRPPNRTIYSKLEKFKKYKYPKFIKDILINSGFDCELALENLDREVIEKIEEDVELNKGWIKDTVYEDKKQKFKFLLGHQALLLQIPQVLKEIRKKKDRKSKKKTRNCRQCPKRKTGEKNSKLSYSEKNCI